jgi:hypothetical protein
MTDSDLSNLDEGLRADNEFFNFIEIFHECDFSPKIRGKFFLIKYNYSENLETEFCDFLLDSLVTYALKKSETDEATAPTSTGQKKIRTNRFRKLYKQAISRYVRGSEKFKGGEIGELILFHILELVEHAVQITNKMSLKTSGNMHFHGADGVHFGVKGNLKILYFGESKTGMKFSSVLYDAMESVNEFCKSRKYKREIELATGYPSDYLTKEVQAEIKEYLTSSKPDLNQFTHTYAILLAYDTKELKNLENATFHGPELIARVHNYYKSKIEEITSTIIEKHSEYPDLQNKLFIFYLIPFKDLPSVRDAVLKEVNNAD